MVEGRQEKWAEELGAEVKSVTPPLRWVSHALTRGGSNALASSFEP